MVETGELRPITIGMFGSDLFDGSRESRRTRVALGRLMDDFCGKGNQRFYQSLKGTPDFYERMRREIDMNVFHAVRDFYYLSKRKSLRDFYLQQGKQAIGAITAFYEDKWPELRPFAELKDEISSLSDSPSDFFWLLSRPSEDIDRTLQYEIVRHALLTIISGKINAVHLRERSHSTLSSVHNYLRRELFTGKIGEGGYITVDSAHDDVTNEVVGLPEKGQVIPRTAHLKRIPFNVRPSKDFGRVYSSHRKKRDNNVIYKAIADAVSEDGVIKVDDVQDRLGIMFVTIEQNVDPRDLAEQVVSTIKNGPKPVKKVLPEPEADKNRGQSSGFRFDDRRIVLFEDSSVPMELVFLSLKNFLNSEYEVGSPDPETGLYKGQGHKLFEIRRGLIVGKVLFPEDIYFCRDVIPTRLDDIFLARSKMTAQELKERYKVSY